MQDVTELESWIGKRQTRRAIINERQAQLMAVTLGIDAPTSGEVLPGLWHWCWFNDALAKEDLGRDGHAKLGKVLPPIPLPRRMWAGGKLEFHRPIEIGAEHVRNTVIKDIVKKEGRSGQLYVLNIEHEILRNDELCLREQQNLVYREDPAPDTPQPSPPEPPNGSQRVKEFTPDQVTMFRYSALTFNGHRIHYDVDYARDVEGYRGLVFHAPLTATMLFQLACEIACGIDQLVASFSYRATSPLFCNETIKLCGKHEEDKIVVWAENPHGHQAMIGEALLMPVNH